MGPIAYLPILRHSLTISFGRMAFRPHRLRPNFRSLRILRLSRRLRVRFRGGVGGRHLASLGLHDRAGLYICDRDGFGPDALGGRPDPFWFGLGEDLVFNWFCYSLVHDCTYVADLGVSLALDVFCLGLGDDFVGCGSDSRFFMSALQSKTWKAKTYCIRLSGTACGRWLSSSPACKPWS